MTTSTTRANLTRLDLAIRRALEQCAAYGYEYSTEGGLTCIGNTYWEPYCKTDVWAGREVVRHFVAHYNDRMWHTKWSQERVEIAVERILHAIQKLESVAG